jgi:hypothetical protein
MLAPFDKALAGALGPLLAWALLALLQSLLGPVPPDAAAGVQTLAALGVTAALVYLVPNKRRDGAAARGGGAS